MSLKFRQVRVMSQQLYCDTLADIAAGRGVAPEDVERELLDGISAAWSSAGLFIRFHQKTPLLRSAARPLTPREFLSFLASWFRAP